MDSRQEGHDWERYDEATQAVLEDMGLAPRVYIVSPWVDWALIVGAFIGYAALGVIAWLLIRP